MQYDNFLLKLYRSSADDPRYQAQVLVPDTADGGRFDLPLTSAQLIELRDQSGSLRGYARSGTTFRRGLGYVPAHETVEQVTRQLQANLPPPLQRAIRESLAAALQRGRGLRLGVLVDPTAAELAELPWEMLWDPDWSGSYLAQSPYAPIVRLAATSFPPSYWQDGGGMAIRSNNGDRFVLGVPPLPAAPRSVLVALVGAAQELQVAGALEEAESIAQTLVPQTAVKVLQPPVTLGALEAALRDHPYQVLHVITHGQADNNLALAYLLFDPPSVPVRTSSGDPDKVIGARLLSLLQGQPELELIVFSSCRSAAAVPPRSLAGPLPNTPPTAGGAFLANSLGGQVATGTGVPVVAMQFDILAPAEVGAGDPTRSWARAFYQELGHGEGAEAAVTAARRVLKVDKDPVLWAAPTLFVPLYWTMPPLPLYERLDRRIYRGLAAAMEDNGQVLLEG